MSVRHKVTEVPHVISLSEVAEPNSEFRSSFTDVVVASSDARKCEWEMMREQQDPIANLHLVRERPIIPLVLWQNILTDRQQIRDINREVQTDVSSGQAFDGVSN